MPCNRSCPFGGECDCGRSRKAVVTEGIGQDGRPFVAVDGAPVHVVHELVQDSAGRLSLAITDLSEAPICGPERLGDTLDKLAVQVAERVRES